MMVDRISDLPDELLSHILSFLPTKLAFTTTVLSKRWTPLCYSLPVLHFEFGWENLSQTNHQHREDTFYQFSRFVDTLMLSHLSTNKPLKSFLLICPFGYGEQYSHIFNAWFEAAKERRVEEFHLTMLFHDLNPITFISQTLVVLKLMNVVIGNDTSCVDLPSLKTLHLSLVEFENLNDYIGFLSACPNLEDLHAEQVFCRKPCRKNTSKLVGAT
jgi:hypothetical protein